MSDTARLIIELIGFGVLVIAGAVWLRSALAKQRHEELSELAATRGDRIRDLESHVTRLQEQVSGLQGQIDMLRALKTAEIAEGVVELLAPHFDNGDEAP